MHSILVVGLLPGQTSIIERGCKDVDVKLRFVQARHGGELHGVGKAEHCVIMVKFVDHRHSNNAINSFGRERVTLNRGGLKELVKTIHDIASRRNK